MPIGALMSCSRCKQVFYTITLQNSPIEGTVGLSSTLASYWIHWAQQNLELRITFKAAWRFCSCTLTDWICDSFCICSKGWCLWTLSLVSIDLVISGLSQSIVIPEANQYSIKGLGPYASKPYTLWIKRSVSGVSSSHRPLFLHFMSRSAKGNQYYYDNNN